MFWGDGWSYLNKIEGFTQPLPTKPAVLIRAWISLQHHHKNVHQFCESFPTNKKRTTIHHHPSTVKRFFFQNLINQHLREKMRVSTTHGTWTKKTCPPKSSSKSTYIPPLQVAVVMVHPPKRCWWHPAHPTHQQHEALNLPTNETCSNQHRAIRLNTWKDERANKKNGGLNE